MRCTPNGFTVVELLVMILVAAILVGMVPVMAQSNSDARTKLDANQIKDIHKGFLHYAMDGDGTSTIHFGYFGLTVRDDLE